MDVIKLNEELQNEATQLLKLTNILNHLGKIGKIELGGSYVYGTMVDRDIDIAVILDKKSINMDLRKTFMAYLVSFKELEGIAMTDRLQYPKSKAPNGIWFGPIFNYKGNKWNIDIWFVTQNEPNSHHNLDLHKLMLKISEQQRTTILDIKHTALELGVKEKGVTSSQIYKAVMLNNISSYEEFAKLKF